MTGNEFAPVSTPISYVTAPEYMSGDAPAAELRNDAAPPHPTRPRPAQPRSTPFHPIPPHSTPPHPTRLRLTPPHPTPLHPPPPPPRSNPTTPHPTPPTAASAPGPPPPGPYGVPRSLVGGCHERPDRPPKAIMTVCACLPVRNNTNNMRRVTSAVTIPHPDAQRVDDPCKLWPSSNVVLRGAEGFQELARVATTCELAEPLGSRLTLLARHEGFAHGSMWGI